MPGTEEITGDLVAKGEITILTGDPSEDDGYVPPEDDE